MPLCSVCSCYWWCIASTGWRLSFAPHLHVEATIVCFRDTDIAQSSTPRPRSLAYNWSLQLALRQLLLSWEVVRLVVNLG